MSGYDIPMLAPDDMPITLVPEAKAQKRELTPETPVVCMNRGLGELRDMFDGQPYVIPPGPQKFWLPYGAAKHFQNRIIIPGTRTGGTDGFQSYICILGLDPPEQCEMFDTAEWRAQQARPEGLDRASLDPSRQDATVVQTATARAGIAGQGAGGRRVEVHGGDRDDVLAPPEGGSVARQDEAEARAAGHQPGAGVTTLVSEHGQAPDMGEQPAPAPMRGQKGRR